MKLKLIKINFDDQINSELKKIMIHMFYKCYKSANIC